MLKLFKENLLTKNIYKKNKNKIEVSCQIKSQRSKICITVSVSHTHHTFSPQLTTSSTKRAPVGCGPTRLGAPALPQSLLPPSIWAPPNSPSF